MFEIISRLKTHVGQTPEKLAVDDGETRLSYAELWQASAVLCAQIAAIDIAREQPVFVCLNRSTEMLVAYCAALMSERSYVQLDPSHPLELRKQHLAAVGQGILVASPSTAAGLESTGNPVVHVGGPSPDVSAPGLLSSPLAPTIILFTSGSTGRSKGVLLAQQAVLRGADACADRFLLSAQSRVLHFAAPAFDSSTLEWVMALTCGASLLMVPDHIRDDPENLGQFLLDQEITHAILPSALLPYLPLRDDYALKAIISAGDVCPEPILWAWADKYPTFNGYGPSEVTICASLTRVTPNHSVSIQDTLDCVSMRIYDADGVEADTGEIWLGGPQVALGYLDSDTAKHDAFLTDVTGMRWFKTGDQARRNDDGRVLFAGRSDAQVKIRGNRVDLSQLEYVVAGLPSVRNVCCLADTPQGADKQLFIFAASDGERAQLERHIYEAIAQALPDYYRPSAVDVMPELPKTANDKVDRKALKETIVRAGAERDTLAVLFARETNRPHPDEQDNFFASGGNSIAVLRLLRTIAEHYDTHLSLQDFQCDPTLAGLRNLIETGATPDAALAITAAEPQQHYPLTPQQEAIWFLHQSHPDSKAYLAEAAMWFEGKFDPDAMEHALNQVFARHEIYRTVFGEVDGTPYQKVLTQCIQPLPRLDLCHVKPAEHATELARIFKRDLPNIDDLASRPPVRFLLIAFAPDLHVLLHQEHHIIHDGWGGSVFTDELIQTYRALVDAAFVHAPEPTPQYLDFANAQRHFLDSPNASNQLAYWHDRLADCPDGVALFGKKSTGLDFEGGVERMVFSAQEWAQIESGCQAIGITTFAFTSAILMLCLAQHSGQDDLTIGSAFANRSWGNSHDVLGMLVNTVVLRHKLDGQTTMRDTLAQMHQTVQDAQANERYPFAKLVEKLNPDRNGSNPFFNVLLGFHDTPLTAQTPAGLEWTKDETVESATSKFDLDCLVIPRKGKFRQDNEVHFLWEYRSDVYDAAEISTFLQNFRHMFLGALDRLDEEIDTFEMICPKQSEKLAHWGKGARLLAQSPLIDSIRHRAQSQPQAPALTDDDGHLTYHQFLEQADNLARRLRESGLSEGGCVALELPRGNALSVGFLATWIAGGNVFVADAHMPPERRKYLHETAKPELIVLPDNVVKSVPDHIGQNNDPDRAYVVFTSGSTGLPKGVEVGRHNLQNMCELHCKLFDLDADTVGVSIAYPSFDAYMAEVWPVLMAGGHIVSVSDQKRGTLAMFSNILNEQRVTHACLSTGLFEAAQATGFIWPSSLKTLLTGGDRLGSVLLAQDANYRLFNMYGPTETTVDVLYYEIAQDHELPPPIGRPVPNATAYVVDAANRICPIGVEGELIVGGAGIAKGYLGQKQLTADRFVSGDQFGLSADQRLYRTGDFAFWGHDGQVRFVGRKDNEVKVRGFRVNLAEITRLLMADPRVSQATAAMNTEQLTGYVVPTADTADQVKNGQLKPQALARQLLAALRKQLPDFMRPNSITVLESLPLTPQGKIDRRALPSPIKANTGYVAPEGATQIAVAAMWSEYLSRAQISALDSFFTIGGHSLLAIKILSRLSKVFGITLKLEDFFNNFTIQDLARLIDTLVALKERPSNEDAVVEEGEI